MRDINNVIDEAICFLADDRVDAGIDNLYELAIMYKSAGIPATSFVDICSYIEQQAIAKSDEQFVKQKINIALTKIRGQKRGAILRVH